MITGIAVVLPYEPAVTAVLARVSTRSTLAEPLKLTADAVASPLALKLREVCKVVAVPALPLALPVRSPVMPLVALSVVKLPAATVVPPIITPLIAPPVSATLLASCVAIVPKPKFVLAAGAALAPVPPFATDSNPVTKTLDAKFIAAALATPLLNCTTPFAVLKSCPVPPYCVPIADPVQSPETTLPNRTSSRVEPLLWVKSNRLLAESYFKRPPLLPI